ncbi:MAG: hypothetical protein JW793_14335 [Acidobacteria bacterium]|nr:hypothetical protein [Acidobacteriota bacterium]
MRANHPGGGRRRGVLILKTALVQALFFAGAFASGPAQEPAAAEEDPPASMPGSGPWRTAPGTTALAAFQKGGDAGHPAESPEEPGTQIRVELYYGEDKLVLVSDRQERAGGTLYRAAGNVVITFLDMRVTCDEAEYDGFTLRVSTRGETGFRGKRVSLTSSGVEFDPDAKTVILHDVSGYFYETSGRSDREFFLTGGMVQSIKSDRFQIDW